MVPRNIMCELFPLQTRMRKTANSILYCCCIYTRYCCCVLLYIRTWNTNSTCTPNIIRKGCRPWWDTVYVHGNVSRNPNTKHTLDSLTGFLLFFFVFFFLQIRQLWLNFASYLVRDTSGALVLYLVLENFIYNIRVHVDVISGTCQVSGIVFVKSVLQLPFGIQPVERKATTDSLAASFAYCHRP